MDDSPSDSGFWATFTKFFKGKNGAALEEVEEAILDACEEGNLESEDVTMLMNVLRLEEKYVSDIMIPRTDTICADITESIEDACKVIAEYGHSRLPVYKGDKDNIVGIIHAKDLLPVLMKQDNAPETIEAVMRKPFYVPENKNIREMLLEFQTKRQHLAIALDEYGGTSGLVTLEDVLEEIVGEIEDEYDTPLPEDILKHEDGSAKVSGRATLDDINLSFDLNLDSENVETIGGYLTELSGRVPDKGDVFTLEGMRFIIAEASPKFIQWLHVEPVAFENE